MINDRRRVIGRRRRAYPPRALTAAATLATVGLVVLAAGCGGSPGSHVAQLGSTGTGSTASSSASAVSAQQHGWLAFSGCMRSHGVSNFPDPTSGGELPKVSPQQLGVSSTLFLAAQNHCRYLLPNGGSGASQTQVQQLMSGMLKFAQCMRSHGVSNWPDPVIDAGGNPEFYLDGKVNQNSPQISSKIHGCLHWLPSFAISPGNPVACSGANPGGGPGCGACSCRRRA
jgi:hypothetical protein